MVRTLEHGEDELERTLSWLGLFCCWFGGMFLGGEGRISLHFGNKTNFESVTA